jgi:hypothetical protein
VLSGAGTRGLNAREVIVMVKKVLTWGGIAFVIYYLATSPEGAAHVVDGAIDWLKNAGNSFGDFLNNIRL